MIYLHTGIIYIVGIVPEELESSADSGKTEETKEKQRKHKKEAYLLFLAWTVYLLQKCYYCMVDCSHCEMSFIPLLGLNQQWWELLAFQKPQGVLLTQGTACPR